MHLLRHWVGPLARNPLGQTQVMEHTAPDGHCCTFLHALPRFTFLKHWPPTSTSVGRQPVKIKCNQTAMNSAHIFIAAAAFKWNTLDHAANFSLQNKCDFSLITNICCDNQSSYRELQKASQVKTTAISSSTIPTVNVFRCPMTSFCSVFKGVNICVNDYSHISLLSAAEATIKSCRCEWNAKIFSDVESITDVCHTDQHHGACHERITAVNEYDIRELVYCRITDHWSRADVSKVLCWG